MILTGDGSGGVLVVRSVLLRGEVSHGPAAELHFSNWNEKIQISSLVLSNKEVLMSVLPPLLINDSYSAKNVDDYSQLGFVLFLN